MGGNSFFSARFSPAGKAAVLHPPHFYCWSPRTQNNPAQTKETGVENIYLRVGVAPRVGPDSFHFFLLPGDALWTGPAQHLLGQSAPRHGGETLRGFVCVLGGHPPKPWRGPDDPNPSAAPPAPAGHAAFWAPWKTRPNSSARAATCPVCPAGDVSHLSFFLGTAGSRLAAGSRGKPSGSGVSAGCVSRLLSLRRVPREPPAPRCRGIPASPTGRRRGALPGSQRGCGRARRGADAPHPSRTRMAGGSRESHPRPYRTRSPALHPWPADGEPGGMRYLRCGTSAPPPRPGHGSCGLSPVLLPRHSRAPGRGWLPGPRLRSAPAAGAALQSPPLSVPACLCFKSTRSYM